MSVAQRSSIQQIFLGIGGEFLYFPAWWYGKGLRHAVRYAGDFVTGYARQLGVATWIKNIFVPMFGRYDWQSRIISVFMRLANVCARGFATMIVAILVLIVFGIYIVLPFVAILFVIFHATAIFPL